MSDIIKLQDRNFKIMIPAQQLDQAVCNVAQRINEDYKGKNTPVFIGVLNGAFMFLSDLMKQIDFDCEVTFIKLASYNGGLCSSGVIKNDDCLSVDIKGRDVIIVEDIVDTGNSIEHLIKGLSKEEPASLEVCTLFFKPKAYTKSYPIKYPAKEIGNEFIVGYGLDYNYIGRNLKDIYVVTE